jgi:hypothetical protein
VILHILGVGVARSCIGRTSWAPCSVAGNVLEMRARQARRLVSQSRSAGPEP